MGCGVIGNTAVSGTVIRGSSPCTPALIDRRPARNSEQQGRRSSFSGEMHTSGATDSWVGSPGPLLSLRIATWPVRLVA